MSSYKKPKWQRPYFYKNYMFKWLPHVDILKEVLWKDKYDTPRVELMPFIEIEWLWFVFRIQRGCDQSWEQWLWVHKYCDGDAVKGKSTWPWQHGFGSDENEKGTSTWIDYK